MDNNDFILKIVAELEQKGIKTGYDKLKKELEKDPAKIDVILNTSGTIGKTKGSIKKLAAELHNELTVEISKLQKQGQDINLDLTVGDVEKVIQNVITQTNKLEKEFDTATSKAQKFLAQFNNKSGGTLINSVEYKAVQEAINGLGNTHSIDDLNKSMNTLETTYNNMVSSLRNSGKSLNPFINAKNEMAVMSETIKGIGLEFEQLSSKPKSVADAIGELSTQQAKVDSYTIGTQEWADAYGQLQHMIQKVTAEISNLQKAQSSKSLQPQIDKIQLLSNGSIKNDYSTQIEGNFRSLGFTEDEIQNKTSNVTKAFDILKTRINQPFDESNYQEIISLNDKLQKELIESSNEYTKLQASAKGFVSVQQRLSKANTIEAWNQKNSAATKQTIAANEAYITSLRDLNTQMTKMQFNVISDEFKKTENSMRSLGKLGASFKDQMSQAAQSFTQWISVSSGVMLLISKTKEAISEIKELDNILTEISKTSDMTSQQLQQLGMNAYDAASKYGRTASDYLLGVQEMARSGFYGEKGSAMAEQSLLAQSAGDMNAELANNYILATNAAYKLNGEADKLNAVLDGQNSITNRNSVAMEDMATAMSEAGTVASSYRVSIEDLSAMIGTIESVTKLGGSEVGNAIKAILINLQNITSDKIVDTLDAANASMTEFVNGAEKLRNPIDILRDLAKTFNQLDEDDPLRAEILTNIGQKYHAAKLGALLQNMEMFDKMLVDYSEGTGSALEESNKSAENLTGTLNKLSNSWTEFVNSIIKSDGLKSGIKILDGLVQGTTHLLDELGSLGTIGLGAGLFTGVKNTGKCRMSVRIS